VDFRLEEPLSGDAQGIPVINRNLPRYLARLTHLFNFFQQSCGSLRLHAGWSANRPEISDICDSPFSLIRWLPHRLDRSANL